MHAINRLQRDHRILREKLQVLEVALTLGPESRFVVRETCVSLSRRLADHLRRADRLMAVSAKALAEGGVGRLWLEHHVDGFRFRIAIDPFLEGGDALFIRATPVLRTAIGCLRDHMAQVETKLFPLLEERALAGPFDAAPPGLGVDAAMTVNHLLREHPETKPVFERLLVSMPSEGYECLDEVAWRHGLEAEELVARLQDVIREKGETRS